jgi:hypothetical protein
MSASVMADRQLPEQHSDRYIVVRVSARVEVNLHALLDAHTRRTVRLYRSRQLALSDAALLNRRQVGGRDRSPATHTELG